jgi:hypothetical protein
MRKSLYVTVLLISLAVPAVAQTPQQFMLVVPWHGGSAQVIPNCYAEAAKVDAKQLNQFNMTGMTGILNQQGSSCVKNFYTVDGTDTLVGQFRKEIEQQKKAYDDLGAAMVRQVNEAVATKELTSDQVVEVKKKVTAELAVEYGKQIEALQQQIKVLMKQVKHLEGK